MRFIEFTRDIEHAAPRRPDDASSAASVSYEDDQLHARSAR